MINVGIACDENYSKYAGVVIASILSNANQEDDLSFYILTDGLSEKIQADIFKLKEIKDCQIKIITLENKLFEAYKSIKTHSYIPICGFYRLKLASILPDVDKIIYLDCDVVVNKSLNELYNSDLGENIVGGVRDINRRMLKRNPSYVNAGMLVMDLKKIREQNIEDEFLNWTKNHIDTIKMGDQEIINEVLKGRIQILDDRWNVQSSNFTNRSSYTKNPWIIHYVSKRKPWHFGSFSYHKDYYFKYLQLTPWALTDEDKKYWYNKNKSASFWGYLKYRPFFMFRPMFYKALFYTYIKPID